MIPLAETLRPKTYDDVVGQNSVLNLLKQLKNPFSILLWGPPGCGKTTIAKLYAKHFDAQFMTFSGAYSGSAEIKSLLKEIQAMPLINQRRVLFIDEIHRFNKAQQDIFLPYLENGSVTLIGATTENPSFSLNDALLSRLRVFQLQHLDPSHLQTILNRAKQSHNLALTSEADKRLIELSGGDARHFLNLLENLLAVAPEKTLDAGDLEPLIQSRAPKYDKHSDQHYNLISALHKSIRGSDPDAALYWLARMLSAGEDPGYIARRLMRMATEDIGLADPSAVQHVLAAWQGFERLGSPEGDLLLAQAAIYLALSPKSNAAYTAYAKAAAQVKQTAHLDPPKHILNAPTKLMKDHGYGKNYAYDHNCPDGFSGQNYFPEELDRPSYYSPIERGFERDLKKRLEYFEKLRKKLKL